jgi:quercetin dioxygenase-like cupin family protein
MTRDEFAAAAVADGFEVMEAEIAPNVERPPHTHPFDARLFILEGTFTLVVGDQRTSFRPGEVCSLGAGTVHQEVTGADGTRYVAGRRMVARASAAE